MKHGKNSGSKHKKALALVLCAALIAGGVYMAIPLIGSLKFKNDTLKYCSVSTGGGMRGGSLYMKLAKAEDGGAVLTVSEKESYNDREITTTYRVGAETLERVAQMADQYGLYRASKRPYSRMRVLDAATTTLSFQFTKDDYSVSGERVLSAKMRRGFNAVIDYLRSLASGDGVKTKAPQTATLHLKSGYTLRFTVEDAFDGMLNGILTEDRNVSAFRENGIVLAPWDAPALSGDTLTDAEGGTIVYDPQSDQIILLYTDFSFEEPVYLLAKLDGTPDTACPLIAEMEGEYSMNLN